MYLGSGIEYLVVGRVEMLPQIWRNGA